MGTTWHHLALPWSIAHPFKQQRSYRIREHLQPGKEYRSGHSITVTLIRIHIDIHTPPVLSSPSSLRVVVPLSIRPTLPRFNVNQQLSFFFKTNIQTLSTTPHDYTTIMLMDLLLNDHDNHNLDTPSIQTRKNPGTNKRKRRHTHRSVPGFRCETLFVSNAKKRNRSHDRENKRPDFGPLCIMHRRCSYG